MATASEGDIVDVGMMDEHVPGQGNGGLPDAERGTPSTTPLSTYDDAATGVTDSTDRLGWIKTQRNQKLAVENPSKVEAELHARLLEREKPSVVWLALKWVITGFVMSAVLVCLAGNKITAIQLSQNLGNYRLNDTMDLLTSSDKCSDRDKNASSIFIMLLLTLMIPQGFTLLLAIWNGSFRSDRPWPSNKALVAGIVASLLETCGITLFTVEVMTLTEPHVSVLLMNGIFLVPIILKLLKFCTHRALVGMLKVLVLAFIIAFILEVTGLSLFAVFEFRKSGYPDKNIWEIPLALLCISFAWTPWLQEMQITPRTISKRETQTLIRARTTSIYNSCSISVSDRGYPTAEDVHVYAREKALKDPSRSARWKQAILTSCWKLLLTPAFSLLFTTVLRIYPVGKLHCGLQAITPSHHMFAPFMVNIFLTFGGYGLAIIGCAMCMQVATFAVPLVLTTPLTVTLTYVNQSCTFFGLNCTLLSPDVDDTSELSWVIVASCCLYLAQLLSTGYFVIRSQTIVMHPEAKLFWLPGYCGAFLEQLLLLGRKTQQTDEHAEDIVRKANRTRVYICTTMYRETEEEMEQLLRSLDTINRAQQKSATHFESHIFFDGAVRETKSTEFVLQLVALLHRTLRVETDKCTKVMTPYGMRLTWALPSSDGKGMNFNIHLKDNLKVKNKKRWSQIMYMSYVIDWLMKQEHGVRDDETFILTTDADVKFSPESVEALLDLMTRDSSVGAVCARTYPLGSGPVVWYQVFDYAIGHWFQKAANHVLGSVLCSPGCFSVYRIRALKDVVSTYASKVSRASEFLTKDMGEDRWLCTLLVQSGWLLEYCAVSEDSTYCPEEFDEFYKQRRRWIPSTLANQVLLLQEWKIATHFNDHIGYLFLLYQAILLFSTLVGPATCMLVIAGGLHYAYNWDQIAVMVVLILVTVGYTLICLYGSQELQLKVAKLLTFIFALVMAVVAIGTAAMIVDDLTSRDNTTTTVAPITVPPNMSYASFWKDPITTTEHPGIPGIPGHVSVSTLCFGFIVGIFLLAGLLHLNEIYCLVHGIWYWLCLPSGYLLLTIYSVCNITDRSWGTREAKSSTILDDVPWQEKFTNFFWKVFFCCAKKDKQNDEHDPEEPRPRLNSYSTIAEEAEDGERVTSLPDELSESGIDAAMSVTAYSSDGLLSKAMRASDTKIPIRRWLRYRFKKYAPLFEDKGYDTSGLIHGMTNDELKDIGIKKSPDRKALLDDIKLLPPTDIETAVPNDYVKWLEDIGLPMYMANFKRNHVTDEKGFERLKSMSFEELSKDLGVNKPGHIKRLIVAISKLRYPTDREIRIRNAKWDIDNATLYDLRRVNRDEYEFWYHLAETTLRPDSKAFGQEDELKEKLSDLRNTTLMAFTIVNALWILIIMTLSAKTNLNIIGSNALGVASLVVFGLAMVVQLLCMIVHRLATLMHHLARAPFTTKGSINTSWSFTKNSTEQIDPEDESAIRHRDDINEEVKRIMAARNDRSGSGSSAHQSTQATFTIETPRRLYQSMGERQPLLRDSAPTRPI